MEERPVHTVRRLDETRGSMKKRVVPHGSLGNKDSSNNNFQSIEALAAMPMDNVQVLMDREAR